MVVASNPATRAGSEQSRNKACMEASQGWGGVPDGRLLLSVVGPALPRDRERGLPRSRTRTPCAPLRQGAGAGHSGALQGARTGAATYGGRRRGLLQLEVERQRGETAALQATVARGGLVLDEVDIADQAFAGGVGEVVPQVLVAGQVDLGGQVTMAGRRDEEVDVRRTLAVAAEQVQAFLGRTLRVAAVTAGHDAAGAVAAFGIGDDAAAQVVVALALVEVGVVALGVGVPQIDHRARY